MDISAKTIKQAIIIYANYYDRQGRDLTIGGIQTYINHLREIFKELHIACHIVQPAKQHFTFEIENGFVIGIPGEKAIHLKKPIEARFLPYETLIIFASESFSYKHNYPLSLCIQHGIVWDSEVKKTPFWNMNQMLRIVRVQKILRDILNHKFYVHVDLNFINWARTYNLQSQFQSIYIPNFSSLELSLSDIKEIIEDWDKKKKIKILYPRRFRVERGAHLLPELVQLLQKNQIPFQLTISGEGDLDNYLKKSFNGNPNILFDRVESNQNMLSHYKKNDIVIIPSIASEGTSIVGMEAMATGCLLIAADIGGIGNMIIDGFNGVIFPAGNMCRLAKKIGFFLQYSDEAKKLILNAYKVYQSSFSYDIWKTRWKELLSNRFPIGSFGDS